LRKAGYTVEMAASGTAALAAFQHRPPDLVLLDVMLPELDGLAVCHHIRQRQQVEGPALRRPLAVKPHQRGLELGADDYIAKPFRLRELLARVAAALRRPRLGDGVRSTTAPPLIAGDLTLDPAAHTARRGDRALTLKPRAFALLRFFMEHPNQVFTRDQLLRQLWDDPFIGDARTVDVHVRWIREQIEDDPSHPQYLRTIRNVGYQFVG